MRVKLGDLIKHFGLCPEATSLVLRAFADKEVAETKVFRTKDFDHICDYFVAGIGKRSLLTLLFGEKTFSINDLTEISDDLFDAVLEGCLDNKHPIEQLELTITPDGMRRLHKLYSKQATKESFTREVFGYLDFEIADELDEHLGGDARIIIAKKYKGDKFYEVLCEIVCRSLERRKK